MTNPLVASMETVYSEVDNDQGAFASIVSRGVGLSAGSVVPDLKLKSYPIAAYSVPIYLTERCEDADIVWVLAGDKTPLHFK